MTIVSHLKFPASQGLTRFSLSRVRLSGLAGRGVRPDVVALLTVAGGSLFVATAAVLLPILLWFAIAATAGDDDMTDTFQPLGALAAAVVEKCAQRSGHEPSPHTIHQRSVIAVQARRDISRAVDKLIAARGRDAAATFLREKLEQVS